MVNNGENRVETIGKGKIGDEVCTDVHPRHCAWLKWNGGASRLHVASFEVSTPIAARYVLPDVQGQPGPIVLAFYQFLGLLIAQVPGNRGVMMGGDDLHAEILSIRDIHPTGGVVEEVITFLADSFLLALVVDLCLSLCGQSIKDQRSKIGGGRGMNLIWGDYHYALVVICNTDGVVFLAG